MFGKGDLAKRFTAGWSVAGFSTFASGQPIQLSESDDRDLVGDFSFPFDTPSAARNGSRLYNNRNPRSRQVPTSTFGRCRARYSSCFNFNDGSGRGYFAPLFPWSRHRQLQYVVAERYADHRDNAVAVPGRGVQRIQSCAIQQSERANINNTGQGGFGYVTSARDPRILQVALKLLF